MATSLAWVMAQIRNKWSRSQLVLPSWTLCPSFTVNGNRKESLKVLHPWLRVWPMVVSTQALRRIRMVPSLRLRHSTKALTISRRTLCQSSYSQTKSQRIRVIVSKELSEAIRRWLREVSSTTKDLEKSPKSWLMPWKSMRALNRLKKSRSKKLWTAKTETLTIFLLRFKGT